MINPYLVFGLLGLGGAGLATVLFAQFIPPVAAWIVTINLSALGMYRVDKVLASTNTTRVPELILWMLEAIGGAIGAIIAMWFIRPRHKT